MNWQNFFGKRHVLSLCCLTLIAAVSQATFAQEMPAEVAPDNHERLYQVEMIVFTRNDTKSQQELWPKNIKLAYPASLVLLKPADAMDTNNFTLLNPDDRQLNSQAASLAKSASYTVLFHEAWRQMIYAKNTAVFIGGGKTFNGHQELEGSIELSVAQYLKIHTNLWLTEFTSAQSNLDASTTIDGSTGWPELPTPPGLELSEPANEYAVKRIVKMNQHRSMRSVEIHYIDHPLLGIIIKIVPYDPPR